jgi:hypothetical protein
MLKRLWLLLLCSAAFAQQQPVNVGTAPNAGNGDPLRTAFTKLNANDAQLYTQYVRTAAEITAGITPTNYGYLPLNVLRYGADPTGVADSTTAINNCNLVAAASNGRCVFAPGTYTDATSVTIKTGVVDDCQGATITYSGSSYAFTTPTTGTTNYAGISNCVINLTNNAAGAIQGLSLYKSTFNNIHIGGTSVGTTNILIALGTNTSGTNNPAGNLNNSFNKWDTISAELQFGTGMQLLGADSAHFVTDNSYNNIEFNGAPNGGAMVYGIEFNQWCDTNIFSGHTLVRLNTTSPANGIGVAFATGSGGGVYAEVFESLAVDVFGSPATDNRQGIWADGSTTVKFVVVDMFEYGPTQGLGGLPNLQSLLSSVINQAPRSVTNYQTLDMAGTNLGVGVIPLNNVTLTVQNVGQSTGSAQYNIFAGTAGQNSGSPSLVAGIASQPGLATSTSYNVNQVMSFYAPNTTYGANATSSNAYSYFDAGQTAGATANYGFYSAAASPGYSFYGAGTGSTVLGGTLSLTGAGALSGASWTTNGLALKGTAQTLTDTNGTGTIPQETAAALPAYTIAATNTGVTIQQLSELYLPVPAAGTNVTATNLWSLNTAGGIRDVGSFVGLLGETVSGGSIFLNQSSNFGTNIGTGTTTSQVTIGNGANIVVLGPTEINNGTTATVATATGCSGTNGTPTSVAGGPQSGTFVSASSGTSCSFVITINGATGKIAAHSWHCIGSDTVTGVVLAQKSTATTTCTLFGTVNATTDTISWFAMGD